MPDQKSIDTGSLLSRINAIRSSLTNLCETVDDMACHDNGEVLQAACKDVSDAAGNLDRVLDAVVAQLNGKV